MFLRSVFGGHSSSLMTHLGLFGLLFSLYWLWWPWHCEGSALRLPRGPRSSDCTRTVGTSGDATLSALTCSAEILASWNLVCIWSILSAKYSENVSPKEHTDPSEGGSAVSVACLKTFSVLMRIVQRPKISLRTWAKRVGKRLSGDTQHLCLPSILRVYQLGKQIQLLGGIASRWHYGKGKHTV